MELGGVATRQTLLVRAPRVEVDRALARGEIVALARGRYGLPVLDDGVRAAHALSGVLCLTSASLSHGWEVLRPPGKPHVAVARGRRIEPARCAGVHLHRQDLGPDDVTGPATSVELTLMQCFRSLEYGEALAVGDSALRHGVAPATMARIAASARGPGSQRVRQVAAAVSPDAANPFESALRAIAHDVPGLHVQPQRVIGLRGSDVRPDLVDEDLRIVLEADSFEWHGGRADLARDAHRYNLLVVEGWLVLRFAWEDVMLDAAHVRAVLIDAVALVAGHTDWPSTPPLAA